MRPRSESLQRRNKGVRQIKVRLELTERNKGKRQEEVRVEFSQNLFHKRDAFLQMSSSRV